MAGDDQRLLAVGEIKAAHTHVEINRRADA
jgi:hypothetical protein